MRLRMVGNDSNTGYVKSTDMKSRLDWIGGSPGGIDSFSNVRFPACLQLYCLTPIIPRH